jgi:hypothetical protein
MAAAINHGELIVLNQELIADAAIGARLMVMQSTPDTHGVKRVKLPTATTDVIVGLGRNDSAVADTETLNVLRLGVGRGISGAGPLAVGVELSANAAGKLVAAGSGDWVCGILEKACTAADQEVSVRLVGYRLP